MMGKSQFALFFLCSFTLNIESGLALRCYGCQPPDEKVTSGKIPNDAPKCDNGVGVEFDCANGSCAKVVMTDGRSNKFVLKNLFWYILLTYFTPSTLFSKTVLFERGNRKGTGK